MNIEAFYVTMIDGPAGGANTRVAWLAGPFDTKEAAEPFVFPASEAAADIDGRNWFYAFGVTRIERTQDALDGRPWFKGRLNAQLGLEA
jgi:hypothetical protein